MKFKETKIGFVPKDWEKLELKDIIEIKKVTFNPSKSNEIKKCIELEHINQEIGTINGYTYSNLQKSNKYIFRKGDILFGKLRAYLKKFWKAKFNGVCSSEIWVFNGKKIINDFLFYFIQQNKFIHIANVSIGSKMPRADWNFMSNIPFLIPPLKEQQKIAKILLTCDEMIEKQEKLIKEKEKLKKGLMQKLLNVEVNGELKKLPKVRFKEFSGEQKNGEWVEKKLGEVSKLRNGYAFKSKDYTKNGKYKILTISNVKNGYLDLTKVIKINFFPEDIQSYQILNIEDILISMTGNVGRVCLVNENNCLLNQRVGKLEIDNSEIHYKFLYYFINQNRFEKKMISLAQGGAQLNISKKDIENFKIFIPPTLKEQEKIADVFLTIDKEINLLKLELEEFKKLKKSLMQKLLTGKVRVKV